MELRFPNPEYPHGMVERFGSVIEPRLRPGEELSDILVGSGKLALRRAQLHQREAMPLDMEYVLAMWCWWPFKPELENQAVDLLCGLRAELFSGAAESPPRDRLAEVPDKALALSIEELYDLQRLGEWPYAHLGPAALS